MNIPITVLTFHDVSTNADEPKELFSSRDYIEAFMQLQYPFMDIIILTSCTILPRRPCMPSTGSVSSNKGFAHFHSNTSCQPIHHQLFPLKHLHPASPSSPLTAQLRQPQPILRLGQCLLCAPSPSSSRHRMCHTLLNS